MRPLGATTTQGPRTDGEDAYPSIEATTAGAVPTQR